MKRALFIVAVAVAIISTAPSQSFAQPSVDTAPVTGIKPDRVTAPLGFREAMQKREAVKRQRRAGAVLK